MEPKMTSAVGKQSARTASNFGTYIALGLCLGFTAGLLLENISMGLVAGLSAAAVVNAYSELRQGQKGAGLALGISLLALLFVIVVWVFFGRALR